MVKQEKAMDVNERVSRQIGDLVIQNHSLAVEIERLKAKLAEYENKKRKKPDLKVVQQ